MSRFLFFYFFTPHPKFRHKFALFKKYISQILRLFPKLNRIILINNPARYQTFHGTMRGLIWHSYIACKGRIGLIFAAATHTRPFLPPISLFLGVVESRQTHLTLTSCKTHTEAGFYLTVCLTLQHINRRKSLKLSLITCHNSLII